MLEKIYEEQKVINKNVQRMNSTLLLMLFAKIGRDAKMQKDEQGKRLGKIGLCLVAVMQMILLIEDVADFINLKKK